MRPGILASLPNLYPLSLLSPSTLHKRGEKKKRYTAVYARTQLCTHMTVEDDGVGEEPPHDDWGLGAALKMQKHWGVPAQPVARAL
jgi:hypothetical protein